MERNKQRREVVSEYIGGPVEESEKLNQVMGLMEMFGASPRVGVDLVPRNPMASGGFVPLDNRVVLSPLTKGKDRESVATHEYVHALDNLMMKTAQRIRPGSRLLFGVFDERFSPEQEQFAEGYAKMTNLPASLPRGIAGSQQVFRPDGIQTEGLSPYRRSRSEQRAWGVSEQINSQSPGSSHMDATRATEFDILMDLLSRTKRK